MVSGFSRFITAVIFSSGTSADLLAEVWQLISTQMLAVPLRLIWVNVAGTGRGSHFAPGVSEFTGVLATKIVHLKPLDPEFKASVCQGTWACVRWIDSREIW